MDEGQEKKPTLTYGILRKEVERLSTGILNGKLTILHDLLD